MTGVRVKICGIREPAHGVAAVEAGADYLGVVFALRTRRVTPAAAAVILDAVAGRARGVGVFVDETPATVLAHRDAAGFEIAQLHGAETPETCAEIRAAGLAVWKALRPRSRAELAELFGRYAEVADGLLVEGFSPRAPGGTGTSFPHEWLAEARRGPAGSRPELVLAGGLDPANVRDAIEAVRPDAVDVSSGVETGPGVKSVELIRSFLAAAKGTGAPA